jgi:hypothetical protein
VCCCCCSCNSNSCGCWWCCCSLQHTTCSPCPCPSSSPSPCLQGDLLLQSCADPCCPCRLPLGRSMCTITTCECVQQQLPLLQD